MARSRGGRPAARPASRPSSPPPASRGYSSRAAPAPAPAPHAAPPLAAAPAPSYAPAPAAGGGMMSGMMGTMAQGMALGAGSAVAHKAVDGAWNAMTGGGGASGHVEPQQVQAAASQLQAQDHPCADGAKQFAECMSRNGGDMPACEYFFNAMQQCRQANP